VTQQAGLVGRDQMVATSGAAPICLLWNGALPSFLRSSTMG
jgi:hypothetical protein